MCIRDRLYPVTDDLEKWLAKQIEEFAKYTDAIREFLLKVGICEINHSMSPAEAYDCAQLALKSIEGIHDQRVVKYDCDMKRKLMSEMCIRDSWYVDEDCTIPWKPEDDFEEDLKLYPGWEKEADVKTEEPSEIKPTEKKPAPKQNDSMLMMLSAAAAVIVAGTILYIKKRRKTNK